QRVNKTSVESLNHKLTEYFSIRKSDRRTKREIQEEKRRLLEFALRKGVEDGLEVRHIKGKGRGVFATKDFLRGEFVVEYSGDLIDMNEAYKREEIYEQDENTGCYMDENNSLVEVKGEKQIADNFNNYFVSSIRDISQAIPNVNEWTADDNFLLPAFTEFKLLDLNALAESGKLGRLINHSRNGNLITKTMMVDGKPRLALIANVGIKKGQELLYDYGDRSRESLEHHPWLAF
ncbi:hypothetical protein NQ314_015976, partial [Rhamnusium bicolor]